MNTIHLFDQSIVYEERAECGLYSKSFPMSEGDIGHRNGYSKFRRRAGSESLARRTYVIIFIWALK